MTITKTTLLGGAALLATTLAHAGTNIDSRGFTLEYGNGGGAFDMNIVADDGHTVQIAMRGLQPLYNDMAVTDNGGMARSDWDAASTELFGSVRPGYRITSVTLAGSVTGVLDVAAPDSACGSTFTCTPGTASNGSVLTWGVDRDGDISALPSMRWDNVQGTRAFALTGTVALDSPFALEIDTQHSAYAAAGMQVRGPAEIDYVATHAATRFGDMVMTVQVAAVPEPGTWAMLLAGLGMMGAVARRRRG